MNKKKVLAVFLVLLVILLGGASIYVATQLSTRKAVAPTAPESKPKAAELTYVGSPECTVTGLATDVACVPSEVVTCNPDCPTECGHIGSTISTCEDSCGVAVEKSCPNTAACPRISMSITKGAYEDDPSNVDGAYQLVKSINSVTAGQTFVYSLSFSNTGLATVSGIVLTDTLTGENLDKLAFVDADTGCTFDDVERTVTCTSGTITPGMASKKAFRVKVANDVANGLTIKNTVSMVYGEITKSEPVLATKSLTTVVVGKAVLEGSKTAYKNVTSNTPGVYSLTDETPSVSKSQIYVYSIELHNTGTATATGVTIKDSLKNVTNLTYMDTISGCSWNATDVELTCSTTINPDQIKKFSFRVRAGAGIANGEIISNTAKVTYNGGTPFDLTKDLTISTVVGCNNTCTTDAECVSGLTCDTTTSKCRTATCATEDDCVCVIPTAPPTGTAPTRAAAPTRTTVSPTESVTAAATPTILPETGIFDLPGIAAFGGGLFLAVIGILLAL